MEIIYGAVTVVGSLSPSGVSVINGVLILSCFFVDFWWGVGETASGNRNRCIVCSPCLPRA